MLKEKFGSSNQQDEYKNAFREEIGALMPLATNSCKNSDLNDARREDRISHFILRLAFCQIPEQSDWFVRLETELFRMRFQYETRKNLASFLSSNDLNLKSVDFVDVLELLSSHRVYLNSGTAFISINDLVALVSPRFRDNITASMNHARKEIGFLQENDRLIPLMTNIVKGGVSYRKEFQDPNAEHISPDMGASSATFRKATVWTLLEGQNSSKRWTAKSLRKNMLTTFATCTARREAALTKSLYRVHPLFLVVYRPRKTATDVRSTVGLNIDQINHILDLSKTHRFDKIF
uniref:Uncharacterized protein n=1 Tax=Globodera pallida TaxID=36090 RepID=A0A183C1X3_GLOPA